MKTTDMKKRNKCGFSLAETLVALLIILLVGSVIAAGIPAATKAYVNVIESANAQVFLSTTLTELRNELATARDITISGNAIEYTNPITGVSKIELVKEEDQASFLLTTYIDLDESGVDRPLVSDADHTMTLDFGDSAPFQSFSNGVLTLNPFDVQSSRTDSVLASIASYKINVLVPQE